MTFQDQWAPCKPHRMQFWGKSTHCKVQGLYAMSCAKTTKSIDLPFCLWTWMGLRKHKLNHICQMVPMCTSSIVFARWRQYAQQHSAMICGKIAELIEMPFWLWTRVGPRKHVLHGVHIGASWRIRLNRRCPAALQKRLNQLRCHLECGHG